MADYKALLQQLETDLAQLASGNLDEDSLDLVEGMREDIADVLGSDSVPGFLSHRLNFFAMEFEADHPQITALANQIVTTLSTMGI
jgi:hypothetical protein